MFDLTKKNYCYFEEINDGVLRFIPPTADQAKPTVLDVGCGTGVLGEAIGRRGYQVWGIEENPEAALTAKSRLSAVIEGDLTDFEGITKQIGDRQFDYLILSDVLEHLGDPLSVLKRCVGFLKKGGCLIASFPNAVVWTNRISVLFGRFEYKDSGVMDKTHLRFFTFSSAKRLVSASGCRVERTGFTPHLVRAFLPMLKWMLGFRSGAAPRKPQRGQLMNSPWYRLYLKTVYPIERLIGAIRPQLFAFRIIVKASK